MSVLRKESGGEVLPDSMLFVDEVVVESRRTKSPGFAFLSFQAFVHLRRIYLLNGFDTVDFMVFLEHVSDQTNFER